jgi:predicted transcriptional regulator
VISSPNAAYRDRIHIVKDLILKLVECGELNQTALMSFCGLNLKKHRSVLEGMEANGLIARREEANGKRITSIYTPTHKGIQFCNEILEPYERMFPRRTKKDKSITTRLASLHT